MNHFLKLFDKKRLHTKEKHQSLGLNLSHICQGCQVHVCPRELEKNQACCPCCGYHNPLSAQKRIELLTDRESFQELFTDLKPVDALEFKDVETYVLRLKAAQDKTARDEAIYVGKGLISGIAVALGVMDFSFMGGSMGSVVGEKITRLVEFALENHMPVVMICASGGARMQESTLSLMQMAKTSAAFARLSSKGLPYISVLTHPTMGGVTASFATLGDIILAEPGALIGFAGPRVVEQTTKRALPKGAQSAEFMLEKGMIDQICSRNALKSRLTFFLDFFLKGCKLRAQDNESAGQKVRQLLHSSKTSEVEKETLFLA